MKQLISVLMLSLLLTGCGAPQIVKDSQVDSSRRSSTKMAQIEESKEQKPSSTSKKEIAYKQTAKHAQSIRETIVESDSNYSLSELEKVPFKEINAITQYTERRGGDIGVTADRIAQKYPSVYKTSDKEQEDIGEGNDSDDVHNRTD